MTATTRTRKEAKDPHPGPYIDEALRTIAEEDPDAFCGWLGEFPEHPVEILSSNFVKESMEADLVVRVAPDRLAHVEYIQDPRRAAAIKMVAYRGQLMRIHPGCSIKQYAVVVSDGRLPSVDDLPAGFALGLTTIYLRDLDPAKSLAYPSLGALAVLGRGDVETRARALRKATQGIQGYETEQQVRLMESLTTLATLRLDPPTVDQVMEEAREDNNMTVESVAEFYSHTTMGHEIRRKGQEQGSARVLTALMQSRFGDHDQIPIIAQHLAQSSDEETSVRAVTEANSLDDLTAWLLPSTSTEF
jgi:hypothetical protein